MDISNLRSADCVRVSNSSIGLGLMIEERSSQFQRGFGAKNDSVYTDGELISAADAHICAAEGEMDDALDIWPFHKLRFHANTPISSLAKAGALFAAEIDRRIAAGENY